MKPKGKIKKSLDKKRLLIVLVSVFVGAVVLFGAVFGIIAAVRNARAAMKYRSTYLSAGVASYLASTYKTDFIKGLGIEVTDTPDFWNSEYKDGISYADTLRQETERYIRNVVAGSYLFDRYATLTSYERAAIKNAAEERLDYLYNGDKNKFNSDTSMMGFDYSDFLDATEMLYKYGRARNAIYGDNGEVLTAAAYYRECDKYYKQYSHVKLLFIRTESEFVTDENGNRVTENGKDKTEPLNSFEKAERLGDIADIAAAIDALKSGENMQMTPLLFDTYLEKYSYDIEFDRGGYYFAPDSEYTSLFINNPDGIDDYKEIALTALSMEEGEYEKVQYGDGICYIYKYEREAGAYAFGRYSDFFSDFYSLAADYLYFENLNAISEEVEIRDKFRAIDPVNLPYNTYITARVEVN